jgi:general L-amino acid transport system substrate-binding protein
MGPPDLEARSGSAPRSNLRRQDRENMARPGRAAGRAARARERAKIDIGAPARRNGGSGGRPPRRTLETGSLTMRSIVTAFAAAGLWMSGALAAQAGTLDTIKARGALICGSNPGLAGFALPDDQGVYKGLDVDECRALAAAIFDDPTKVKYIPINAKDRPTILASGEIDVLIRNTTWTMSREVAGMFFTGVNFYDGQGFMVRKALGINSALKLDGASVCVQQGTTTELNLADYFRANNMKLEAVVFSTDEETVKAYDSGRCDAYTTDASGLYADRLKLSVPADNIVLPEIISKEPLGPSVRKDDINWFEIVQWTHYALVTAEELGVTQANVDEKLKSTNPSIRRLLGVEGDFGKSIGLTNDWAYRMIKAVGNYGESFERNVGMGSPLRIARGLNALWTKGGLQYAPPIR